MAKMEARCKEVGTITIETQTTCGDKRGNCDCGAYDHYRISDVENLHSVTAQFAWIERPNGRIVRGAAYTKRMAQNDFRSAR